MIVKVANSNMEKAVKVISVEKGYDPREFTLVSFGGAGGLHACELSKDIGIKQVIFPLNSGVLSAMGMLFADSYKDYSRGYFMDCEEIEIYRLEEQFEILQRKAAEELKSNTLEYERFIDARYKNQSHELTLNYGPEFINDFHNLHLTRYGFNSRDKSVEIVNVRVKAFIRRSEQTVPKLITGKKEVVSDNIESFIDFKKTAINCYYREDFYPGFEFSGPCIVVEDTSTIYIPNGFNCITDEYGNIISSLILH